MDAGQNTRGVSLDCPACRIAAADVVATIRAARVIECGGCGLLWCDPMPVSDAPSAGNCSAPTLAAYSEQMLSISDSMRSRIESVARGRFESYAQALGRPQFRLLEIGCGNAALGEVYERLGVDYTGIDLDARQIEFAKRRGVRNVSVADFLSEDLNGFDVVVASQVLEHVMNPVRFVEGIARSLRSGGVIHLDVPNAESLSSRVHRRIRRNADRYSAIEWPHHVFGYTGTALLQLLRPIFELRVFGASSHDLPWGQVNAASPAASAYFRAAKAIGMPNMLVAFGRKAATVVA